MEKIDLLGLDEFGQAASPLHYVYGAAGAGVTGTLISKIVQMMTTQGSSAYNQSHNIGYGVSGLVGGLLMIDDKTRPLGIGALVGATIGLIATNMGSPKRSELGIVQPEYLGMIQPEYLSGSLGTVQALPEPHAYTSVPGVAGTREDDGKPPTGLSPSNSAGAQQTQMLGGPATSNLSSSYGATVF